MENTMPDNGIFEAPAPETTVVEPVVKDSGTAVPPEVANLVGPGKKYATIEAALKSILPAQVHIGTIEQDNADLRKKLEALEAERKNVDDVLAEIKGGQEKTVTTESNPDSIAERVLDTLDKRKEATAATLNLQASSDALIAKFGSKEAAQKALTDKAESLGLTVPDLMHTAAKSPAAFLVYFDTKLEPRVPNPTGSVNTDALNVHGRGNQPAEGTYAWFQALRKVKGDNWYFSPPIAKQRTDSATKLGVDKFFGRK
jgi:uncharacterized protein YfcZ (UPF0381/DUF406 family)